jgi:RND family efflux transporter MFP subunit
MSDLKDQLAALRIEREAQRARLPRWVLWVVVLVILAAGGAAAWGLVTREHPIEVEAASVSERAAGMQAAVLNASGYVVARRRATVSSKITGKVTEVNVEEGMAVREGQILARLDDATSRAALALAEAQAEAARRAVRENEVRLAEAKLSLGRVLQLVKDQLATQAEVDKARAEVDSLDARIAAAREQVRVSERQAELERTNLDNTVIRAPFSGVAISKDAQPGEMVSPVSAGGGFTRTGICTIVDMRSLEIEVDVNESYINRVQADQRVSAVLNAYPEWQIPAHVITTVPAADRQKATVLVRIGFDLPALDQAQSSAEQRRRARVPGSSLVKDEPLDPRILPDMGVKVTFLRNADAASPAATTQAQPVTLVPKAAIKSEGDQSYAFVVNRQTVERRAVRTGGPDGDRVEVIAGLRPGETVVVSPPAELTDGALIQVR